MINVNSLSLFLFLLQMYSQYISNFDTALKTLEEQQKKNSLFSQVIKEFELEPKCANLTVAAYLLETVQRIPRYKLLLAGEKRERGGGREGGYIHRFLIFCMQGKGS